VRPKDFRASNSRGLPPPSGWCALGDNSECSTPSRHREVPSISSPTPLPHGAPPAATSRRPNRDAPQDGHAEPMTAPTASSDAHAVTYGQPAQTTEAAPASADAPSRVTTHPDGSRPARQPSPTCRPALPATSRVLRLAMRSSHGTRPSGVPLRVVPGRFLRRSCGVVSSSAECW
jgi:hypothetical protein